ncbi:MAG: hypothetical protein A9Z00_01705 [Thermobacillus sp. ZCTH02-B1]|uniref:hypothetical protein n=1 Tax=Thermobacillus sp. ZCTH02-B1 TaxID=1858795 RepID=UPI000B55ED45|nr:hypothetical protein [Thermobacillus sp. ZCTH02-B1]OUM97174.1 MAG: hypothetical protein A9Z00_01705 [Thermobacillus sp. ZCTH02-B1]
METAQPRIASGHAAARGAGGNAADSHPAEEDGAGSPRPAGGEAGGAIRAGAVHRLVIASYAKFKGSGPPGRAEGMPPALLIGAHLDVRV